MSASESGPASIAEAFVRNAERAPETLCLRFEGEEISYRSLRERAEGFGPGLEAWGLRPGERVALFLPEFGGRVVVAVVREDPGLTAERVTDFCREDLAGFKKPREVVFVEELPRKALGKVLKHRVREGLSEPEE